MAGLLSPTLFNIRHCGQVRTVAYTPINETSKAIHAMRGVSVISTKLCSLLCCLVCGQTLIFLIVDSCALIRGHRGQAWALVDISNVNIYP